MGVIDDRLDLDAKLKLGIQLILAHFVYEQGIKIESMYGLFGIYELSPWAQYLLTILVIAGAVNAFNLMDGVDGLAAGLAFASFFVLACLAYVLGSHGVMTVMLTFMAALLGFLRYNFSKRKKVFLGDAGSLMIGFILVVTGIRLIQSAAGTEFVSIAVVGVVSVLVIPVLDALRVFWKRMKAGNSPFAADKTHLHHLLLSLGKRHKMTSFSILVLMTAIVGIGCGIHFTFGLTAAILSMFVLFSLTVSLLGFQITLMKWKLRIREMERK
jgi:UDP-GlcNAc:undecaprenyl-phosphate GlcNAc-1-phosphate transferase